MAGRLRCGQSGSSYVLTVASGVPPDVEGVHPAARIGQRKIKRYRASPVHSAGLEEPALRLAGCPPPRR